MCNSSYHNHQIEIPTSPNVVIFFSGCVSENFVPSYSVSCFIYIPRKLFLFQLQLCSLWCVQIIEYIMACRSNSYVCILHHLIIIMLTYLNALDISNVSQIYFVECGCRIKSVLLIIFMHYMGLCVFSLSISLVMIVKICVLYLIIIIKMEIWMIYHCLGLGHEIMLCSLCLALLLSSLITYILYIEYDNTISNTSNTEIENTIAHFAARHIRLT